MSRFMVAMPSAVLIERPPVSKVMPLPTSTTRAVRRPAPAALDRAAFTDLAGV
jgi:hypothetical protein